MYNGDAVDLIWDKFYEYIKDSNNEDPKTHVVKDVKHLQEHLRDYIKNNIVDYKLYNTDEGIANRTNQLWGLWTYEVLNLRCKPERKYIQYMWDEHASLTTCYWDMLNHMIIYDYDDERIVWNPLFPKRYLKDEKEYLWKHYSKSDDVDKYYGHLYSALGTMIFNKWYDYKQYQNPFGYYVKEEKKRAKHLKTKPRIEPILKYWFNCIRFRIEFEILNKKLQNDYKNGNEWDGKKVDEGFWLERLGFYEMINEDLKKIINKESA